MQTAAKLPGWGLAALQDSLLLRGVTASGANPPPQEPPDSGGPPTPVGNSHLQGVPGHAQRSRQNPTGTSAFLGEAQPSPSPWQALRYLLCHLSPEQRGVKTTSRATRVPPPAQPAGLCPCQSHCPLHAQSAPPMPVTMASPEVSLPPSLVGVGGSTTWQLP